MVAPDLAQQMKARWLELRDQQDGNVEDPIGTWFQEVRDASKSLVHGIDGLTGKDYSIVGFRDQSTLYFRFLAHTGLNPFGIEFVDDALGNTDQCQWLRKVLEHAHDAASGAPHDSHAVIVVAYLDQVVKGATLAEARNFTLQLASASSPNNDAVATFRSKNAYLPWLRLAAARLRKEFGIVISPGGNGGELWIGPAEDYRDHYEYDTDYSDPAETANAVLERTWEVFAAHGLDEWEDEGGHEGMMLLIGNPYPGSANDHAKIFLEI